MAPPEDLSGGLSCLSQLLVALGFLGFWPRPKISASTCTRLPLFSFVFSCFFQGHLPSFRGHLIPQRLISRPLTLLHLPRPCFHAKACSQVLGVMVNPWSPLLGYHLTCYPDQYGRGFTVNSCGVCVLSDKLILGHEDLAGFKLRLSWAVGSGLAEETGC